MVLTKKTIKNLLGGVSQQPDSIRFDNQCTEQINFLSDPIKGLVKRPGSTLVNPLVTDISTGLWDSYDDRWSHFFKTTDNKEYVFRVEDGYMALWNITDNVRCTLYDAPSGGSRNQILASSQDSYLNYDTSTITKAPYRAVSISDHTFVLNKEVEVSDTTVNDEGVPSFYEGCVFVKQGQYNCTYSVRVEDQLNGVHIQVDATTSTGLATSGGDPDDVKTNVIAEALYRGLDSASPTEPEGITITQSTNSGGGDDWWTTGKGRDLFNIYWRGSVLIIRRGNGTFNDGHKYRIECRDSYGDNLMSSFDRRVDSFEGLPLSCTEGFTLKIEGNPDSNTDDYYVEFKRNSSDTYLSEGSWVETTAQLSSDTLYPQWEGQTGFEFDVNDMPKVLYPDPSNANEFVWQNYSEWVSARAVGDSNTNPIPSFAGQKINDIFYFKGRLGLLSGESCILSELNEPGNFWRTTVTQTLATDRIDIESSVNKVAPFYHAVPFANQLLVFSDNAQFILDYGSAGLTPDTAALALISSYEADKDVRPISLDNSVIFSRNKTSASDIMEMYATGTTNYSFEARNITEQIPSYIQGKVTALEGSSLAGVLLVKTDETARNKLYVYKYYQKGQERILSSWSQYTFQDSTDTQVRDMYFSNDKCYLFIYAKTATPAGDYYFKVTSIRFDNTEDISFSIDDKFSNTDTHIASISYNSGTDRTEVTYIAPTYVEQHGYGAAGKYVFIDQDGVATDSVAGYDLEFPGDLTGATSWDIGIKVPCEYEFSKQYLKQANDFGKEVPIVDGRTTIKWSSAFFSNTQFMQMEVSYPDQNRDTTTKSFSGTVVGGAVIGDQESETGTLRSLVAARNDVPVIKLKSDTHQTATITGAAFELEYNSRLRKV